ncbi:MAG: alpha/beta hydrolase [Limnohabitans sp.]|nr:MAG: alpha/beta hydrolase [Limnohabitans sp.]
MALKDAAWHDRMYNNRALVPDFADHFAFWRQGSEQAREQRPCVLDVAYGDGPNETLDIFPSSRPDAPVVVFIHGGYWRSLDKADHSFVAPPLLDMGACVVVVNYALCPGTEQQPITVPDIALQCARSLAWVWRHIGAHGGNRNDISVIGHSAGGHLAAMMLACRWKDVGADLPADLVRKALSISGLFDLEPVRTTPFVQGDLRLTPAQVRRASPALWAAPKRRVLYTVVGGDESPEFLRHNELIRKAWGARTVPVCEALPGLNHFSVVSALTDPAHRLNQLARQLIA